MPKPSSCMQTLTALLVLWSFVEAVRGNSSALRLWLEAPEGVVALLGVGVGGKMVAQTVERWGARKYATRGEAPPEDEPT